MAIYSQECSFINFKIMTFVPYLKNQLYDVVLTKRVIFDSIFSFVIVLDPDNMEVKVDRFCLLFIIFSVYVFFRKLGLNL